MSLPGERLGDLSSLKHFIVAGCLCLKWQRGLVLPSSLQYLDLLRCGDFSSWIPGCLENLSSLMSLEMVGCEGIISIPASIWGSNLALLQRLEIRHCPNLVSIGGAMAVAKIKEVEISGCPLLKEAEQIMRRDQHSLRNKWQRSQSLASGENDRPVIEGIGNQVYYLSLHGCFFHLRPYLCW